MRISNFLLWQISYAEIWVTEKCWPEFDEADAARSDPRVRGAKAQLRRTWAIVALRVAGLLEQAVQFVDCFAIFS